ncbi:MAG: hypothetical protein ACOC0O_04575 [Spirochaetota bacterium]
MSEDQNALTLSHAELVALYVALSEHESELDPVQNKVLARVAAKLYDELSVSEMEQIESYYNAIAARE